MSRRVQTIHGTPATFDVMLRPLARRAALLLGGLAAIVLIVLRWWWWVPIPLLIFLAINELVWWRRGDRPIQIRLSTDDLRITDRIRQEERRVDVGSVQAVNVWYKQRGDGYDVHVALFDGQHVCFAASTWCAEGDFVPSPTDIDVAQWEAVLGESAGIRTAVATPNAALRQRLSGATLLRWCRERFPMSLHERTWARVWQGVAPELTLFGTHANNPSGWIQSCHEGSLNWPSGASLALSLVPIAHAQRPIVVLQKTSQGPQSVETEIGLVVLARRESTQLVSPCTRETEGARVAIGPSDLHTHAPEAMALLSHTLYHKDKGSLPPAHRTD